MSKIYLYNTLSRSKQEFVPLRPPMVGLYVCGPTVYGEGHLGHARAAITFDILFRLLTAQGYAVRYVRNITDVGHLEHDADDGEDKLAVKARLEQKEPMEVAQYYTNKYHDAMRALNVLSPSIEPRASGHIIEQIELVEKIIANGYAYLRSGSVYFDVRKYAEKYPYGELSGRNLDDIVSGTRALDGQSEKHFAADFALWKKASKEHIMRWNSPWGAGFPGWHCECSAMSAKYLGSPFDIHGGGMDLMFPHHECEIAQSTAASGHSPAKYWLHNNMITIGGQKMGKSLGNFITLTEFFTGSHKLLSKAYDPMVIRFFILMAHYRSTLDFSDEALLAAEKGFLKLMQAWKTIRELAPAGVELQGVAKVDEKCGGELLQKCIDALSDDMNTPIAVAHLFDGVKTINSVKDGLLTLSQQELQQLRYTFDTVLGDILGVDYAGVSGGGAGDGRLPAVMDIVLEIRANAKANRDFATSDLIRDSLKAANITVQDGKEGTTWN